MSEDLVGRTLGPYQIVEALGIGGMATVYKAYQPNMDRHVAVKVLPRHFAHDPTFVGRFQQEARVIARLEHARILPVFDYGETDGITYIVMRFLKAGTLAERIKEGPMPLEDIARITSQIAEGLDYAHKRGVIHRDIKPSNIMLDDSGDAYITDFGISKLAEGTAQFTGSGIVGTPAYLSPEQGLGQPIDHRADIYSLGVMLYQMATGHVPYSAETPMAIVIKHINEPLPPPRSVNPDIPGPVEAVIMKAMAKDPGARYQSAGELAKALNKAVAQAEAEAAVAAPVETAEQVPAHRKPTKASDHTAAISDKGPKTIPLAAATAEAAAPAAKEAPAAPPAQAPAMQAQKRRFPRWLIVVGGLIGLCLCAFLTLLILGNRQQQRDAAATASAAAIVGGLETGDPAPTANVTPTAAREGTGEASGALPPCPPGTSPVTVIDFEAAGQVPEFGDNPDIQTLQDGHHVLVITPPADGAMHFFGQPLTDSALVVDVLFPPVEGVAPGAAALALLSRAQPDSGEFYGAAFGSEGSVTLTRGETPIADPVLRANIFDGLPHRVELQVTGEHISAVIDKQVALEVDDPNPLPPGMFGLYLTGRSAYIDALATCGMGARGNVAFSDDFEGAALSEQWRWSDSTPDGAWEVSGGVLHVTAPPGTGIGYGEPVVAAVLVPEGTYQATVFVDVTPRQHRQGAGMVVLSNTGQPLLTLSRVFCDPEVQAECQGDALFFTRWQPHPDGTYESIGQQIAGVGELPAGGRIGLRLVSEGDSVRALYSLDGSTWHEIGSLPLPDVRIGGVGLITVGGAPENDPLIALFDDFVLLSGPTGP